MDKRMCIQEIEGHLTTDYIGRKIIYQEITESTNNDAKKQGDNGEAEGCIFIAENQTMGKGRMFRTWITSPYESIAMSILLRPAMKPEDAPTMTPVLALSAAEAIRLETGIEAGIKWPNDLFVHDRKLGGILTEMSVALLPTVRLVNGAEVHATGVKHIVAGIGLNVNQEHMDQELGGIATSLKIAAGGKEFNRERLAAAILNRFETNYSLYLENGLGCLRDRLKHFSVVLDREVVVISGLEMIEGVAEDIDEAGNLVLRLEDGRKKSIIYGDVGLKYKNTIMGR